MRETQLPVFLFTLCVACLLPRPDVAADDLPMPTHGDCVLKDFRFVSVPEPRLHYRPLGTPRHDAKSTMYNAVLIQGRDPSGTCTDCKRPWSKTSDR